MRSGKGPRIKAARPIRHAVHDAGQLLSRRVWQAGITLVAPAEPEEQDYWKIAVRKNPGTNAARKVSPVRALRVDRSHAPIDQKLSALAH